MSREALDAFGKIYIERCRTSTIRAWEGIFSGHIKAPDSVALRERLKSKLSDEQMALILEALLPEIVDTVLDKTLWMVEQEERIGLSWDEGGKRVDLRDASDGLSGELYSDEGWIARFGGREE